MLIVEGINLTPAEIVGTAGDKWLHISINGKDYYYKVNDNNELTIEQVRDKYNRWFDKGPQTHGRLIQWLKGQVDKKLYFKEDDTFGSVAQATVNELNGERYIEIEVYDKPYRFKLNKGQDGATLAKKFNSMIEDPDKVMDAFELIIYNSMPDMSINSLNELHKLFRKFDTNSQPVNESEELQEGPIYNGQDIAKTMLQEDEPEESSDIPEDDIVDREDKEVDLTSVFNEMRPLLKDLGLRLFRVHNDDEEVFIPGKLVEDKVVFLDLDDVGGIQYKDQPEDIQGVIDLNTAYHGKLCNVHDLLLKALADSVEYDIDYVERVDKPVEDDTDDIDPDTIDDKIDDIEDASDEAQPDTSDDTTEEPEGEEEDKNV